MLFSLESLITKCLIHRVGAVISGEGGGKEKIKSGQKEHVSWSVTPRLYNGYVSQAWAIEAWPIISLIPHLLCPNSLLLLHHKSSSPHQLIGVNEGLLCREAEWSESRSTEPLHPGIKILSQEVRNMGQVSLSCFLGRRFKGDKSTHECQTNHKDPFWRKWLSHNRF